MDPGRDSPNSGSPLSDIDSDEFPDDVKFRARSRSRSRSRSGSHSPSRNSILSASDDDGSSFVSATARQADVPPAKRRKTGASSYDHATPQSASTLVPPRSPTGSISSDSSGSVPTSPSFANLGPAHPLSSAYAAAQTNPDHPELADAVQVTQCLWEGCTDTEQGNMDNLVAHINDVHIVPRQKKYHCEWEGCPRKGSPHTSAYALKAHMRSHTKEKPFMCSLPECDRSFTRSDALAKHMRTVHETEALRPSDPIPRGHTGGISNGAAAGTVKRLKLTIGGKTNGDKRAAILGDLPPLPTRHSVALMGFHVDDVEMADAHDHALTNGADELADAVDVDIVPLQLPLSADYYPPDVWDEMDDDERNLPPSQYYRLLRRQIHWAEQEGQALQQELEDVRSTVEDSRGHLVARGTGDDKGADENRKLDWLHTRDILDSLLLADADQVMEMVTGERPGAGGDRDALDVMRGLDDMVKVAIEKS